MLKVMSLVKMTVDTKVRKMVVLLVDWKVWKKADWKDKSLVEQKAELLEQMLVGLLVMKKE